MIVVWILLPVLFIGLLFYWLLVVTEGVYLGKRAVTWLYDITAARYDGIKQFQAYDEAIFIGRPLAEALRFDADPLVLDIGTGTGRVPRALLDEQGFRGQIIGIDASLPMLTIAADGLKRDPRVYWIWDDATQLPFPVDTFHAVTCLEMLEFTPSPENQLREAARVLRPGGLLLTSRRRGLDARLMPGKTHSTASFRELLTALGFTDVVIETWQVDYDLVWAVLSSGETQGERAAQSIPLRCYQCGMITELKDETFTCDHCNTGYVVRDGVLQPPDL